MFRRKSAAMNLPSPTRRAKSPGGNGGNKRNSISSPRFYEILDYVATRMNGKMIIKMIVSKIVLKNKKIFLYYVT